LCAQKKDSTFIDSTLLALQKVPAKYINTIDKKIDKYSSRITKKTEKTLTKLAKWESKIKKALEKANPQLAQRLFSNNQLTFAAMLQKFKSGEAIAKNYKAKYDGYTDKLAVNLKYLEENKDKLDKKLLKPLAAAKAKLDSFSDDSKRSEALQQMIKERKKQLLDAAFRTLGKNKYLSKISKESWYYAETMRNYKQIFTDPDKAEKTVKEVLNKIPFFQNFVKQNSQLAAIFGLPSGATPGTVSSGEPVLGLQPRASVQNAIRASLGSSGNVQQMVQKNVQQAQAEINRLKNELIKKGGSGNELSMPDFKPNMQKTKTFWQRIEYGADIQFAKNNSLVPTTSDIAVSIGYKLDDKKIIGFGASYKLGIGTIDNIKFTNQGVGLRSYLDWKMKKKLFISGGFEMNYNAAIKNTGAWQQAALLGVTKKINVKTKWCKATKLQLLFDFLARQHKPVSQPVLFRVGYNF
jgi:hypothetical protein